MERKWNIKKIIKNEKWLLSFLFLALGGISYMVSHAEEAPRASHAPPELDELIPPGQVLLPIELANREALSAILGTTAVVDLLTLNPSTMSPQTKIASRVKMIRSPKNPDYFSILVDEKSSLQILNKPGPYFAIVQNKKQANSNVLQTKKIKKVEISYQE